MESICYINSCSYDLERLKLSTNEDNLPFGKNKFLKNGALQIITTTVNITRKFQPKHIFRVQKDVEPEPAKHHNAKEIIYAWSPFNSGPLNTVSKPCNTV
jgi:hypothetical protein